MKLSNIDEIREILEEMRYHKEKYYELLRRVIALSKDIPNFRIDLDTLEIIENK